MEAKLNYQLTVQTAIKFSWPWLRYSVEEDPTPVSPILGVKVAKKRKKTLFKVCPPLGLYLSYRADDFVVSPQFGNFKFVVSLRWGISLALEAMATLQM